MRTKSSSFTLQRKGSSLIPPHSSLRAFTLVELLVVIGLIAVLVSITIPIAGKIRKSSQEAATRALIGQIESACSAYHSDFNAYPGPMPAAYMVAAEQLLTTGDPLYEATYLNRITSNSASAVWNGMGTNIQRLTGTENLVLGLMGGMQVNPTNGRYGYNKDSLGMGPMKFNSKRPSRGTAYMQATNLSEGHFEDDGGSAKDTIVPEFIDSFSNPMPILYMRARKGSAANNPNTLTDDDNHVVISVVNAPEALVGQYNILEIAAYTQSSIGVGRSLKKADYKNHEGTPETQYPHGLISVDIAQTPGNKASASRYPMDAYAYLTDPASNDPTINNPADRAKKHRARKQDQFILISAGVDRVYGTEDDITNFGDVLP